MPSLRCTFCGESGSPARRLVSGPDGIAICRDCAELAARVLAEPDPLDPDLVLTNISTLLTMDARHGGLLGPVHDVSVAIKRGRIVWFGAPSELPEPYRRLPEIDCGGRMAMPGFVDASSSLLGPPSPTRPEPTVLADTATEALRRMSARGITSASLTVGGSLEPTAETLRLAVARSIHDRLPIHVSVSWRCAPELDGAFMRDVMIPTAGRLADVMVFRCMGDAVRLEAQISAARSKRYMVDCSEPEPVACVPRLGGAVAVRGVPAGKVGATGPTPVIGWWEPGRARNHWSAGERPALVTSSDPSERLVVGMGMVLMAAVDLAGLSISEAMWSVTRAGALATGDGERGWIHLGGPADLVVIDGDEESDLLTRPDSDATWAVISGGVELGR